MEESLNTVNELKSVQIDKHAIRAALEHDPEFFIQFFLGEELIWDVPEFHVELFKELTELNRTKFACAVPREHAKTTLAKLACAWYFLFTDYSFIVYLSNTIGVAVPSTRDIIGFLEAENTRAVFGGITWHIRQDGVGYYEFEIGGKYCILKAFGSQQQVRGLNIRHHRPQLAIVDDVEDRESLATQELYMKLKRWFYGDFRKAMDQRHHKIVQIGNLVAVPSLLDDHINSKYWSSWRLGCLKSDGKPLWSDMWPLKALREDYLEYIEEGLADVWFAEMMNMPIAAGQSIIKPDEINYSPTRVPEETENPFITIDLAISREDWADRCVVSVHGWVEERQQWQIVDYRSWKGIDPINLFWQVMELCYTWNTTVVGIEKAGYQESLKYVFEYLCMEYLILNMTFVLLEASKRKTQRILGWVALLKSGEYALTEGDFTMTQELLNYRPEKKDNVDDHIDSAAYGVQMLRRYMHEIMSQQQSIIQQKPQNALEVCPY